jgi:hypothetical protein
VLFAISMADITRRIDNSVEYAGTNSWFLAPLPSFITSHPLSEDVPLCLPNSSHLTASINQSSSSLVAASIHNAAICCQTRENRSMRGAPLLHSRVLFALASNLRMLTLFCRPPIFSDSKKTTIAKGNAKEKIQQTKDNHGHHQRQQPKWAS